MLNNITTQGVETSSIPVQISKLLQISLILLSLGLTFAFLKESAGNLIAIAGVLVQSIVMLRAPELLINAIKSNNILSSIFYSFLITATLVMSITGSNSILSSGLNEDTAVYEKRERLKQQIDLKMQAIAIFTEMEMISTKAKPAEAELKDLEAELEALGTPSGLYLVAQNIFGANHAPTFITSFVLILSLLIDVVAMTPLTATTKQTVNFSKPEFALVEAFETSNPTPTPPIGTKKTNKLISDVASNVLTFSSNSDVTQIIKAFKAGQLKKLTVKEVRSFLNCKQAYAMQIAKEAKQLMEQMQAA